MSATLQDKFKMTPAQLTVMAEQAGEGELRATSENVRATFAGLAKTMQPADVLFVMLIGHGTADATGGSTSWARIYRGGLESDSRSHQVAE